MTWQRCSRFLLVNRTNFEHPPIQTEIQKKLSSSNTISRKKFDIRIYGISSLGSKGRIYTFYSTGAPLPICIHRAFSEYVIKIKTALMRRFYFERLIPSIYSAI
jgi:hypothetical protein